MGCFSSLQEPRRHQISTFSPDLAPLFHPPKAKPQALHSGATMLLHDVGALIISILNSILYTRNVVRSPPPVAEENQVYLETTVRQIFAQQMDKLFVLAALPPWPLLLGLAISFPVYAPVAHSVPPWPLLLGFLAVLNSFQSLRCMHSFQRSVFWVSGLPSIVS